jgi:SIR2-like domain
MAIEDVDEHYRTLITEIKNGLVTPFLGAGANLCSRPPGATFIQGQYLPDGAELAASLADRFDYPPTDPKELARVAEYAVQTSGSGALYQHLRKLFNHNYPSTPLHVMFAKLRSLLRERGYPAPGLLLVSTNYDDVLERAFAEAGEPVDVVKYMTVVKDSQGRKLEGIFMHFPPEGDPVLIREPKTYTDFPEDEDGNLERSVILKIHGAVHRVDQELDSYVISEDDYIDYLTRTDISALIPKKLVEKLMNSHFLFLGYSLRDWNMRAIFHRIWEERATQWVSWAVQLEPPTLDKKMWSKRGVEILDLGLDEYVAEVDRRLHELKARVPAGA